MESRRQCDTDRRDQRRDGGMHQLPRISAKSGRSDDAGCGKSVPRGCGAGDGRESIDSYLASGEKDDA